MKASYLGSVFRHIFLQLDTVSDHDICMLKASKNNKITIIIISLLLHEMMRWHCYWQLNRHFLFLYGSTTIHWQSHQCFLLDLMTWPFLKYYSCKQWISPTHRKDHTVNVTGETLVPKKIFPGFMMRKSFLYVGTNPIFPTFPAWCWENPCFMLGV